MSDLPMKEATVQEFLTVHHERAPGRAIG